jgi:hypothetical protein
MTQDRSCGPRSRTPASLIAAYVHKFVRFTVFKSRFVSIMPEVRGGDKANAGKFDIDAPEIP